MPCAIGPMFRHSPLVRLPNMSFDTATPLGVLSLSLYRRHIALKSLP